MNIKVSSNFSQKWKIKKYGFRKCVNLLKINYVKG